MDNDKNNAESQSESVSGEACTIVNAKEIQSINFRGAFSKESSEGGWKIIAKQDCEVTLNFKSALGKTDIAIAEDDLVEKDGDTIFLIKKHSIDSYQDMRTSSPLSMDLDKIRTSGSAVSQVKRRSPVPPAPQQKQ